MPIEDLILEAVFLAVTIGFGETIRHWVGRWWESKSSRPDPHEVLETILDGVKANNDGIHILVEALVEEEEEDE
jgi:hypothetical protein